MQETPSHPRVAIGFCMAALSFAGAALAQAPSPGGASTMKAIVHRSYGSPDVLALEDIAKPTPADDEVLVRVHAAAVNPLDFHYMRGTPYFGRVDMGLRTPEVARLGVDFAGTVEAVGKNVTQFKPGDEVFGGRTGAFAEYVTVREDRGVVPKPTNLTFEQAASVPIAAITALQGLRDAGGIRPGQKVLINGASGGVGTFAVQIAKTFGADVTGVCSTRNVDMVRSIGADRVIDYTREDFTASGRRYDMIFDTVGNHSLLELRRALNPGGTYVMVGGPSGRWMAPLDRLIRAFALSPFVSQKLVFVLAKIDKADLSVLRDLLQAGKVKPVIDRRYGLSQVPEAIRYLERGHARGKVVIALDGGGEASPADATLAASSGDGGDTFGADLAALALGVIAVVGAPVVAAIALNRRFQRRNPGKRPYRWGYYLAIQSFVGAVALAVVLEAGVVAAIVSGVVSAVLAWFFGQRSHWAWIALTILSFNPVAWIVNFIYLRKRWAEDSAPAPTP